MSELSAKISAQIAEDQRNGFVVGRYAPIKFAQGWGVARVGAHGEPVGGALQCADQRDAHRKASELNARSTALASHHEQ